MNLCRHWFEGIECHNPDCNYGLYGPRKKRKPKMAHSTWDRTPSNPKTPAWDGPRKDTK